MTIGASSPRGLLVEWIELRSRVEAARAKAIITAIEADLLLKYSEDQPRDEGGRFASSDGASSAGASTSGVWGIPEFRKAIDKAAPKDKGWGEKYSKVWRKDGPTITKDDLRSFEGAIREAHRESMLIVGADGKALSLAVGNVDGVDFPPSMLNGKIDTRGAVVTHNHPSGGPFSDSDIMSLLEFGFGELRAVGKLEGGDVEYSLINDAKTIERSFELRDESYGVVEKAFRDAYARTLEEDHAEDMRKKEAGLPYGEDKFTKGRYAKSMHRRVTYAIEEINKKLGSNLRYAKRAA